MSGPEIPEACPHCAAAPPANQLDTHVAREHADLPPCTARIEPEGGGLYTCTFRAAHDGGEYGTWHASKRDEHMGRYIWNDTATGATPHRPPEPRVRSLNELKAMGVLSHTLVAAGADTPERPFRATCAALHTDAQGNVIPCPNEQADKVSPETPTEEEGDAALPVRPDPRQPAYDAVYEYIRGLGEYMPPDPVHRNAVIWRAVNAALGATPVGRCVSSHCVEGGHILDLGETP